MAKGKTKGRVVSKALGPVRSPFHWMWGRPRKSEEEIKETRGSRAKPMNKEILPLKACGTKRVQKIRARMYQEGAPFEEGLLRQPLAWE